MYSYQSSSSARAWDTEEVQALLDANRTYGSNWKAALEDPKFGPIFKARNRTSRGLEAKFSRLPSTVTIPVKEGTPIKVEPATPSPMTSRPRSRKGSSSATKPSTPSIEEPPIKLPRCGSRSIHKITQVLLLNVPVRKELTEHIIAADASADTYLKRGLCYLEGMEISLALYDFEKAIELDAALDEAYLFKAMSNCARKEFLQAVEDCDTVIRLNPSAEAYFIRGLALFVMGKHEIALVDLQYALQLNNEFELARVVLAVDLIVLAGLAVDSKENLYTRAYGLLSEVALSGMSEPFVKFVESLMETCRMQRGYGVPRK